MIFDNLTLAAIGLFVIISVFLLSTKNRPSCKGERACNKRNEKTINN